MWVAGRPERVIVGVVSWRCFRIRPPTPRFDLTCRFAPPDPTRRNVTDSQRRPSCVRCVVHVVLAAAP